MSVFSFRSMGRLNDSITKSYLDTTQAAVNMIDRNLFERYGDVQAFPLNHALKNQASWFKAGAAANPIVVAMNGYVKLYGFYPLMLAVDLDGRVIATNDRDAAGKPADTAAVYGKNYRETAWFKQALSGNFLKGTGLDGTFVDEVRFDEDVAKASGSDGFCITFAAPIRDENDKIIGIWANFASFSLVEEIVQSAYADYKNRGMHSAEFQLIDRVGRVLLDFDAADGGSATIVRKKELLLKKIYSSKETKPPKQPSRAAPAHSSHTTMNKRRTTLPSMPAPKACSVFLGSSGPSSPTSTLNRRTA